MRKSKLTGPSPVITAYPPEYDCAPLLPTRDSHYLNAMIPTFLNTRTDTTGDLSQKIGLATGDAMNIPGLRCRLNMLHVQTDTLPAKTIFCDFLVLMFRDAMGMNHMLQPTRVDAKNISAK